MNYFLCSMQVKVCCLLWVFLAGSTHSVDRTFLPDAFESCSCGSDTPVRQCLRTHANTDERIKQPVRAEDISPGLQSWEHQQQNSSARPKVVRQKDPTA